MTDLESANVGRKPLGHTDRFVQVVRVERADNFSVHVFLTPQVDTIIVPFSSAQKPKLI